MKPSGHGLARLSGLRIEAGKASIQAEESLWNVATLPAAARDGEYLERESICKRPRADGAGQAGLWPCPAARPGPATTIPVGSRASVDAHDAATAAGRHVLLAAGDGRCRLKRPGAPVRRALGGWLPTGHEHDCDKAQDIGYDDMPACPDPSED